METLVVIVTLVILSGFILSGTLHRALAKKPIIGLALFIGLSAVMVVYFKAMWQLYMVYGMMILMCVEYLALSLLKNNKLQVTMKFNRRVFIISAYVSLFSIFLFAPIKHLPESDVKTPVGSWRMVVESSDRADTLAKVNGLKRKYAVTLYYPIDVDDGKKKPWLDDSVSVKGMALSYGLPNFTIGYLADIKTSAHLSKQIQGSGPALPIVVISHGTKSSNEQFTRLAESLASEGCLVAVMNHPYSAYATNLGKGEYTLGARSAAAQMDYVDQKIELERQLTLAQQGDLVETFKLLDKINQGDYDNRFKGRLNLSRMILVGHQLGGGSVLATLNQMNFISAAVLFNPVVEQLPRSYVLSGSEKPVISLLTADYRQSNNASYLSRYLKTSKLAYTYAPAKGKDLDMLDLASISPLFKMGGLSDGERVRENIFQSQLALCKEVLDIYGRGQIFEKIDEKVNLKTLKLKPLTPEMVDNSQN